MSPDDKVENVYNAGMGYLVARQRVRESDGAALERALTDLDYRLHAFVLAGGFPCDCTEGCPG